jgi:Holliday junction resolvasome RuvABC ATP-dependent DNA helicase subunit
MGKGVRFYRDIIGQADIVARLKAFTNLLSVSGGTAGHILLTGGDGMGKASLAVAIADELDVGFQEVDAARLQITGDFTAILTNLKYRQILLISNLQLLRSTMVVHLQDVLRDGKLEIIIGQGPAAKTYLMDIRPFTLIATCLKKSDCPAELLREFSLVMSLQPYSIPELQAIATSIGKTEGISLDPGAAALIAMQGDGVPGHIGSTLRRVARAINKSDLTEDDVMNAFDAFGINVRPDTTPNLSDNLQDLSGQDFEKLIGVLLTRMDFQVEMTKTTGDGGIDIIAKLDKPIFGGLYLFQCKRFAPDNIVGAPTVRDFYGAVTADRAVKGILITTSDFTAHAREFAQRVGVELIDMKQLQRLFLEYGLTAAQENITTDEYR